MIHKIGDLVERVTKSVKEYGIDPHSSIVVRVGREGKEMEIEEMLVRGGLNGPYLVLQLKQPQ
jgi:hypothetical protein